MSPRYMRGRLARFWWLLLLCAMCAGLGGWIGSALLFTVYSSTALIQVDIRDASAKQSSLLAVDRLTHTGAQLAVSENVLSKVARSGGVNLATLRSEVTAVPVANTQLLAITVRDADSVRAAKLANAIAEEVITEQNRAILQENVASQQVYLASLEALSSNLNTWKAKLAALGNPPSDPAQARSLQVQIDAASAQYDLTQSTLSRVEAIEASETMILRVASPAQPSATPLLSHQIATALAGMVSGFMLGIFLVVGGELLNMRVASPEGVVESFRWTRLGLARDTRETSVNAQGEEYVANLARLLVRETDFLSVERPVRVIALVSANPSPRTSELARRLAQVFAQSGRNTLLVDAHLRDGAQHVALGVPAEPGLSDLILKSKNSQPAAHDVMSCLRLPTQNGDPHLRFLAVGSRPPNPDRALGSNQCKAALEAIVALPAAIILLDTPPALFAGDGASLASAINCAVILIDPATARRGDLAAAGRAISSSTLPILGFVYVEGGRVEMKVGAIRSHSRNAREASLARQ